MKKMHPSNWMFQSLVGKTVSAVEYVDDFDEGITLRFTDGSFLCVCEEMQAGRIQVAASINEAEPVAEPVAEAMSLHEALRIALSEIYATLDKIEQGGDTEESPYWASKDWMTPPDALREAARVIDTHMRTT